MTVQFTAKPYMVKLYAMEVEDQFHMDKNPFINRDDLPSITVPWQVLKVAMRLMTRCVYDDELILPMNKEARIAEELQCAAAIRHGWSPAPIMLKYTYGYSAKIKRPQKVMLSPCFCRRFADLLSAPETLDQLRAVAGKRKLSNQLKFWQDCKGAAGDLYVDDGFSTKVIPGHMCKKLAEVIQAQSEPVKTVASNPSRAAEILAYLRANSKSQVDIQVQSEPIEPVAPPELRLAEIMARLKGYQASQIAHEGLSP